MSILNDENIRKAPYTQIIVSNKCPIHSHTFFEFSICLKGQYKNIVNGSTLDIREGTVLLLRPQDSHYFYCESEHMHRDIYVYPNTLKTICDSIDPNLFDTLNNEPLSVFFQLSDYNLQLFENRMNLFNKTQGRQPLLLQTNHVSAVAEILALWQQHASEKNYAILAPWLDALLRRLNLDYYLSKSIEEISQSTNYSHGYVCRAFKKFMGVSLKEYVEDMKFSYATSLLLNSENNVATIAETLNYGSTSNFIIAFKRKYGITPLQWRKQQSAELSPPPPRQR